MKIDFSFDDSMGYGMYDDFTKKVVLYLPEFKDGSHRNDGYRNSCPKYTENMMIDDIIYVINHESIHWVQQKQEDCKYMNREYIVYNMIGNGKNHYFNVYYNIPKNTRWQKVIGGAII